MKPKFYSKAAIGILTLLFSPFLGSILFANNLKEVGKSKLNPYFLIAGIFWLFIVKLLTNGINPLLQLGIANVTGSSLLTYYFWDKYLAGHDYETKSFWKPTLIFLAACVGLILLQILTSRI
ncbi:hypothetical protein [Mucilaginibacter sp.]|uniref:hypothetical protein n=1 Tax=Mucilaginibacter sp. TaxID=1882438 RepID=UPI0032673E08